MCAGLPCPAVRLSGCCGSPVARRRLGDHDRPVVLGGLELPHALGDLSDHGPGGGRRPRVREVLRLALLREEVVLLLHAPPDHAELAEPGLHGVIEGERDRLRRAGLGPGFEQLVLVPGPLQLRKVGQDPDARDLARVPLVASARGVHDLLPAEGRDHVPEVDPPVAQLPVHHRLEDVEDLGVPAAHEDLQVLLEVQLAVAVLVDLADHDLHLLPGVREAQGDQHDLHGVHGDDLLPLAERVEVALELRALAVVEGDEAVLPLLPQPRALLVLVQQAVVLGAVHLRDQLGLVLGLREAEHRARPARPPRSAAGGARGLAVQVQRERGRGGASPHQRLAVLRHAPPGPDGSVRAPRGVGHGPRRLAWGEA
mmetsp:Transcript_3852/g.11127  ORF Transcript_3852/g.11127 Transcript_3852/m.11127 type:complete len:369 (+) Transcript_3852:19-1125(+)